MRRAHMVLQAAIASKPTEYCKLKLPVRAALICAFFCSLIMLSGVCYPFKAASQSKNARPASLSRRVRIASLSVSMAFMRALNCAT